MVLSNFSCPTARYLGALRGSLIPIGTLAYKIGGCVDVRIDDFSPVPSAGEFSFDGQHSLTRSYTLAPAVSMHLGL